MAGEACAIPHSAQLLQTEEAAEGRSVHLTGSAAAAGAPHQDGSRCFPGCIGGGQDFIDFREK